MAKRPRQPWRRLNGAFRLGQEPKRPTAEALDEQRLTLYLPARLLDWAELQAGRLGIATVQGYCTSLLVDAIEAERSREQVAEAEARRGQLSGFRAIADDPEYLAEWSASAAPRERAEIHFLEAGQAQADVEAKDSEDAMPAPPSPAALAVVRHAGTAGDDADGFLATLRRGEAIPQVRADELLQALNALEIEYRDAQAIPRKVAYALHRLAFEGQVLHTDAWPGSYAAETVNLLRVVQEAVDRVLSGEDIRYYPPGS